MAWIESHQSLATHRKTLAMSRLLGITRAQSIGHLHLLWWWCLDNAPDGDISRIDPIDLAVTMDWRGDANTIIGALVNVGFVDQNMKVHNWEIYAMKLIDRRTENARRNRELRERKKQLLLPLSRDTHVIITRPSRDGATVPNPTVPNPTVPIKKIIKKKIGKKPFGEFVNVFLSDEEYEKLKIQFSGTLPDKIENLSTYKSSKGVSYRSDYATILNWSRKEQNGGNGNGVYKNNSNSNKRGQVITDPSKFTRPEDY